MGRVEKCCCFSLKTGSLIIATLGWIFTIVKIFGMVGAASGSGGQQQQGYHGHGEDETVSAATLAYRIGYAVVSLICCILLVVGIYKRNGNYFIPWLIIDCLECIGCTIITVVCFVFIFLVPNPGNIVLAVTFVVLVGVSALAWYFWVVVYSFYQEVKTEVVHAPAGGNVYYSPTSTNPPPYEKDRQQMA